MNRLWKWSLLVVVAFPAADAVSAADRSEADRRGALVGRVVDVDGKPIGKARVWIEGERRKPLVEATTDDEGNYRLEAIPARLHHMLLVDADGFGLEYRTEIPIFPGTETKTRDVVMAAGRDVVGRILDADGRPKPDLELEWHRSRWLSGGSIGYVGPEFKTTTDREGRFHVRGLPPCLIDGKAEPFGFTLVSPGGTIPPGTGCFRLEDVRLEPDTPVRGTVKDVQGRPLAGIKVETNYVGNHDGLSDAQGRFELRGIPAAMRFRIMVDSPEFAYVNRIAANDGSQVDIVLKPCVYLTGRVVDAKTGEAVRYEGLTLCVANREPGGRIVREGCRTIDAEQTEPGRFRIACDGAVNHCLSVSAAGYLDTELFIDQLTRVARGDNLVVKLQRNDEKPEQGQGLAGTIKDRNRPIAGTWVSLWKHEAGSNVDAGHIQRGRMVPTSGPHRPAECLTAADGSFALKVPYAGAWHVVIDEPGGRRTIVPVEIQSNEERPLDVAVVDGGAITGRVRGIPPEWDGYLWVVAFDQGVHRAEVRVGKGGTFRLDHLPPGEYGLKAGHDGYDEPAITRKGRDWPAVIEALQKPARPWEGATVVRVTSGRTLEGIELECPAKGE